MLGEGWGSMYHQCRLGVGLRYCDTYHILKRTVLSPEKDCVQTVVKPSILGSYRTCSSCNSANYRTCSLDGHLPSAHVLACGVTFDVYQT